MVTLSSQGNLFILLAQELTQTKWVVNGIIVVMVAGIVTVVTQILFCLSVSSLR